MAWTDDGEALVLETTWDGFAEAMGFVNAVAFLAEQANHHPDIRISWNKVRLRLWSHDVHAITDRDRALAARIEELLP